MSKIYAEVEYTPNEVKPLSIQFDDYSTVALVTSVYGDGVAIFKNGTGQDLSATNMPSGSAAVSGNIITTRPIQLLEGKNFYIVAVVVTVNGTSQQESGYVRINVVDEKSGLFRKK